MRRTVLALAITAILVPLAHAATTEVKVKDNFFSRDQVTINKGDEVRWVWRGYNQHQIAIKKPDSSTVARRSAVKTDGKFVHQFGKVGTWRILCEVHPRKMRMKVIVSAP